MVWIGWRLIRSSIKSFQKWWFEFSIMQSIHTLWPNFDVFLHRIFLVLFFISFPLSFVYSTCKFFVGFFSQFAVVEPNKTKHIAWVFAKSCFFKLATQCKIFIKCFIVFSVVSYFFIVLFYFLILKWQVLFSRISLISHFGQSVE